MLINVIEVTTDTVALVTLRWRFVTVKSKCRTAWAAFTRDVYSPVTTSVLWDCVHAVRISAVKTLSVSTCQWGSAQSSHRVPLWNTFLKKSSVQIKTVSTRSGKRMCAVYRLSEVFPSLPFRQLHCVSFFFLSFFSGKDTERVENYKCNATMGERPVTRQIWGYPGNTPDKSQQC